MAKPPRVVAFGECMLELQGQAFGTMRQGFGGDTLNTAVYMARCGSGRSQRLRVDYATALGTDGLSDGLIERWLAEGVGVELVRRLPDRMPGLYLIELQAGGERRFSYWREQAAARAYFDVASTPLEAAADTIDALYFSGISLAILPPAGRARLLGLAAALRDRGAMVVFDNNFRPRLWPTLAAAREAFRAATQIATLALMTLDDETALWGHADEAAALQQTLALPCAEVVVKRGARPTVVRISGQPPLEVPTVRVQQVVDTTAAGDSFGGAYLAARLTGAAPTQAAMRGNALAARVVQHHGALIDAALMADLLDAPA